MMYCFWLLSTPSACLIFPSFCYPFFIVSCFYTLVLDCCNLCMHSWCSCCCFCPSEGLLFVYKFFLNEILKLPMHFLCLPSRFIIIIIIIFFILFFYFVLFN